MTNKIDIAQSYGSKLFNTAKEVRTQSKMLDRSSLDNQKSKAFEAVSEKIVALRKLRENGCPQAKIKILNNQLAFLFMVANMMLRQGSSFRPDDGFELLVKQFMLNYNQLSGIDEEVSEKEILEFSNQIIVLNTHQHKGQYIKSAGRALFSPGVLGYTNKTAYFSGADDYTSFTARAGRLLDELARLDNDLSKNNSRGGASICLPPTKKSINRSLYQLIHNSQASNESIKFALLSFSNKLYAGKVEAEITSDLEKNVATLITNYDSKALSPYQHSFSPLPLDKVLAMITSAVKKRDNLSGILAHKNQILEQFIHLSNKEAVEITATGRLFITFLSNLYSALNTEVDAKRFGIISQTESDDFETLRNKTLTTFGKFADSCFKEIKEVVPRLLQEIEKSLAAQNPATENSHQTVEQILFKAVIKVGYSLSESDEDYSLIMGLIQAKSNSEDFEAKLRKIWENDGFAKLESLFKKIHNHSELETIASAIQNTLIEYLGLNYNEEFVINIFAQVAPAFERDSFEHELCKAIVKEWYGDAETAELIWPIKQVIDGKLPLKEFIEHYCQEIESQGGIVTLEEVTKIMFERIKEIPKLSEKLEATITQDFCASSPGADSFEQIMFQVAMQVWHDAGEDLLELVYSSKQAIFDQDLDRLLECKQQAKNNGTPLWILNMGSGAVSKIEISLGDIKKLSFPIKEKGLAKLEWFVESGYKDNPEIPLELRDYVRSKLEKIWLLPKSILLASDPEKFLVTLPEDINMFTVDHIRDLLGRTCSIFTDQCKSPLQRLLQLGEIVRDIGNNYNPSKQLEIVGLKSNVISLTVEREQGISSTTGQIKLEPGLEQGEFPIWFSKLTQAFPAILSAASRSNVDNAIQKWLYEANLDDKTANPQNMVPSVLSNWLGTLDFDKFTLDVSNQYPTYTAKILIKRSDQDAFLKSMIKREQELFGTNKTGFFTTATLEQLDVFWRSVGIIEGVTMEFNGVVTDYGVEVRHLGLLEQEFSGKNTVIYQYQLQIGAEHKAEIFFPLRYLIFDWYDKLKLVDKKISLTDLLELACAQGIITPAQADIFSSIVKAGFLQHEEQPNFSTFTIEELEQRLREQANMFSMTEFQARSGRSYEANLSRLRKDASPEIISTSFSYESSLSQLSLGEE
jgi:hypothetical protein